MPITPSLPGYAASVRGYRSRLLHHFRAADLSLTALTGQVGTLVRTGTATGVDVHGATVTYRDAQAAWTMLDLDADSLRETPALQLSATRGRASWPVVPSAVAPLTLYARFIDRRAGSETGRLYSVNWGSANLEFALLYNGSQAYQALAFDGTNTRASTSGAIGGGGTVMEAIATLTASGIVQLTTSINGGVAAVHAASATLTRPASTTATVNAGNSGLEGSQDLLIARLAYGVRTLDEMRELA